MFREGDLVLIKKGDSDSSRTLDNQIHKVKYSSSKYVVLDSLTSASLSGFHSVWIRECTLVVLSDIDYETVVNRIV